MRYLPIIAVCLGILAVSLAMILGTLHFKIGALSIVVMLVWFYLFNLIKKNGGNIGGI